MSKRDAESDIEEEEEEEEDFVRNSEDEDAQDSRFSKLGGKRRKLRTSEDEEDPSDDDLDDGASLGEEGLPQEEDDDADRSAPRSSKPSKALQSKILTPAQLAKSQLKAKKSGVVYLSRIPAFMKVHTLKSLLSPYGALGRVFLTPEAPARYQARVKAGGNKKRSFVDGWVEFESKKKAKVCAETLNGNIVGGKKGGWYHDDIWNIKYLRGFKWNDLMEQVQSEERERDGRLRAEIQRETRERKTFLDNVERAKVERTREAKRLKREITTTEDVDRGQSDAPSKPSRNGSMTFRQNAIKQKDAEKVMPASVLSKLF